MKCITVRTIKYSALWLTWFCAGTLLAQTQPEGPIVHEWGSFTSVAGSDGEAVQWVPLSFNDLSFDEGAGITSSESSYRSKELPSFVETLHWGVFKQSLPATIRMETPVLYFYSRQAMTVSVQVKFAKGMITEWYPHADAPTRLGGLDEAALYREHNFDGTIAWNGVTLQPGDSVDFPRESADSNNRYYAARETLACPLLVHTSAGDQREKFLFYRGVSLASVPVSAAFTEGGNLRVRSSFPEEISNVIWFERRGDQVGYRIGKSLQDEAVMEPPELTTTLEQLLSDLEEILVARGLYPEEAHAMIRTWRDSWFEEGSRLFYVVPNSFVNSILPLTIAPVPAETVRVFVGRLELISRATQKAVAKALAVDDKVTLAKYERFLVPIMNTIKANEASSGVYVPKSSPPPCRVDENPASAAAMQKQL